MSVRATHLTLGDCVFINNNITSIQGIEAHIYLHGNIVFANNRAFNGVVFVLTKSSEIIFLKDTNASFRNNSAVNYGGVFYVVTEEHYMLSHSIHDVIIDAKVGSRIRSVTSCFINVYNVRSKKQLSFSGSTAGNGGDVVFGGSKVLGDLNCLEAFKNASTFSEQNMASLISTAPSRVCLCHDSEMDCLIVADPNTHTIYPGETIIVPAVVVGQHFGTVTGSVIAQIMVPSGLSPTDVVYIGEGQSSVEFKKGPCTNLKYTFYTNCVDCKVILILQTDNAKVLDIMTTEDNHKLNYTLNLLKSNALNSITEDGLLRDEDFRDSLTANTVDNFITFTEKDKLAFPKEIYEYPLYFNISFRSCPSGFSLTALPPFICDCNDLLMQMPGVTCTIQDQLISRVGSVWIGKYGSSNLQLLSSQLLQYK